ncbi:hypothetical protein [Motilimonas sp. KMU-193]|uniref:hypothetical protein n=1 Tax=Motilimonas sp. KMU-193 TaxID=3388668 RepID=UPI00396B206C
MEPTTLEQLIDEVCQHFRLGHEARANQRYGQLLEILTTQHDQLEANQASHLNQILPPMLAAQSRRDNLFLADILEYEIKPLFNTK